MHLMTIERRSRPNHAGVLDSPTKQDPVSARPRKWWWCEKKKKNSLAWEHLRLVPIALRIGVMMVDGEKKTYFRDEHALVLGPFPLSVMCVTV